MQKRWTLLPLALGLSLCLLTGCQQSADTDTTGNNAAISDSQLYATALGNFLQEQSWQLQEMDTILQELDQIPSQNAYVLGHVAGRAAANRNGGDAYQNLRLNTPDQVVQQIIPLEQDEVLSVYANARLDFLEALADQTDATAVTSTEFVSTLTDLREAFARIYLTQDQLETLLNTDGNAVTDYIQKLQTCTEQLTKATTLLQ